MSVALKTIKIHLNGVWREASIEADQTLADLLRNQFGLTGTKLNCRQGECGSCTVLVNGKGVTSCLVLPASVDGAEIVTVEGLTEAGEPGDIQEAFMEADGSQCGFCTPGMVMSAEALLREDQEPSKEAIYEALAGNLCRCTGYKNIVAAVELAAARRRDGNAARKEEHGKDNRS